MKTHSKFKLIMLVMISMGPGLIPVASQPMTLSEETDIPESFEKAFEKIVDEAENSSEADGKSMKKTGQRLAGMEDISQ